MTKTFSVTLQMRDPSYEDEDGNFYPGNLADASQAVWYTDPDDCDHKYTLCARCVRDWAHEYIGYVYLDISARRRCSHRTVIAVQLDVLADAIFNHMNNERDQT